MIKYRSFKRFNDEAFLNELFNAPFHVYDVFDDINDSYWFFTELYTSILNEHAPIKTKHLKHTQVPFINAELRKAINIKAMLRRRYYKYRRTQD